VAGAADALVGASAGVEVGAGRAVGDRRGIHTQPMSSGKRARTTGRILMSFSSGR